MKKNLSKFLTRRMENLCAREKNGKFSVKKMLDKGCKLVNLISRIFAHWKQWLKYFSAFSNFSFGTVCLFSMLLHTHSTALSPLATTNNGSWWKPRQTQTSDGETWTRKLRNTFNIDRHFRWARKTCFSVFETRSVWNGFSTIYYNQLFVVRL